MRAFAETIVAPITGTHPAPVAVVRLSGPEAWRVASEVFKPWPAFPQPRIVLYGHTLSLDEALAIPFEEGRSYTGEETAEISIHGSPASIQSLLDDCVRSGARPAEPGEFTLRAFLNGKLDLTQAEGIRDAIEAQTARQLRQAAEHRSGRLATELRSIRESLMRLLARIEASVDFSEEVGDLDREAALRTLSSARTELDRLRATSAAGRLLRRGIRLALAGLPNAGKSSMLNRILGMDRAIVSERPGTTRDYVEESVEHGGLVWVLLDTAGLGSPTDEIEREGVRRAQRLLESADFVWYLFDASIGWTAEDQTYFDAIDALKFPIANKCDLPSVCTSAIRTSAMTGDGIELAFDRTVESLGLAVSEGELLVNERHGALIERAIQAIDSTRDALCSSAPDDLAAVGLQEALQAIGEATGDSVSDDVLESIFATFCIGK